VKDSFVLPMDDMPSAQFTATENLSLSNINWS